MIQSGRYKALGIRSLVSYGVHRLSWRSGSTSPPYLCHRLEKTPLSTNVPTFFWNHAGALKQSRENSIQGGQRGSGRREILRYMARRQCLIVFIIQGRVAQLHLLLSMHYSTISVKNHGFIWESYLDT